MAFKHIEKLVMPDFKPPAEQSLCFLHKSTHFLTYCQHVKPILIIAAIHPVLPYFLCNFDFFTLEGCLIDNYTGNYFLNR